jgi:eukaryotic-like serine/threonine-protein kinase
MNIGENIDGKYEIISKLGKGGMGEVFKVKCDDKYFALKVCNDKHEDIIKRFKREVKIMASIEHANVIKVIDSNLDYTEPYFVMPLYKASMDEIIESNKDKQKLIISMLLIVCKGINAIHLSGVIHRDIKPKNILINNKNDLVISDLGLGKFTDSDSSILTSSNALLGTMGYIPPEFYEKNGTQKANIPSDIFQLGKTIYNVFTNKNPAVIEQDILPGGLLYIVTKSTEDKPEERYQSVGDLEDALNNYHLSLEPESNPINAFSNLINIAKDNLKQNIYVRSNIDEIIPSIIAFKDDPVVFFNQFNKIPVRLLEIVSSNFPSHCTNLLETYCPTIEQYFKNNRIDFADAELVAASMYAIHMNTNQTVIKIKTLKVTLFTSVYCNRFNAIDVFNKMLEGINDNEDAVAVVEMLKENKDDYKYIADNIPKRKLHTLIQALQEEIKEENEKKEIVEEETAEITW